MMLETTSPGLQPDARPSLSESQAKPLQKKVSLRGPRYASLNGKAR